MTKGQFQSLVEFIAPRFDELRGGLAEVRGGLAELRGGFAELTTRVTRVEVLQEQQSDRIQLLAEGLASFRETVDSRFAAVDRRFDGMDELVRALAREQRVRTDAVETSVARLERHRRS